MGEITDKEVEWAIVDRLRRMLDDPPTTKFNVTQTFAHFNAILLWTKNRMWVREHDLLGRADRAAAALRVDLRRTPILDRPWLLSRVRPVLTLTKDKKTRPNPGHINGDFEGTTAEDFFKWLRDAIAHGDGRTIRPLHKLSRQTGKTWLAGFKIRFAKRQGSNRHLTLHLYHQDMIRIGSVLAEQFCQSLSGADDFVGDPAAIGEKIEEAA